MMDDDYTPWQNMRLGRAAEDLVNNPHHYQAGDYECRDVRRALCNTLWHGHPEIDAMVDAFRYLWRAPAKGNFVQDMSKCARQVLAAIGQEWRLNIKQEDWQAYCAWKASNTK